MFLYVLEFEKYLENEIARGDDQKSVSFLTYNNSLQEKRFLLLNGEASSHGIISNFSAKKAYLEEVFWNGLHLGFLGSNSRASRKFLKNFLKNRDVSHVRHQGLDVESDSSSSDVSCFSYQILTRAIKNRKFYVIGAVQ